MKWLVNHVKKVFESDLALVCFKQEVLLWRASRAFRPIMYAPFVTFTVCMYRDMFNINWRRYLFFFEIQSWLSNAMQFLNWLINYNKNNLTKWRPLSHPFSLSLLAHPPSPLPAFPLLLAPPPRFLRARYVFHSFGRSNGLEMKWNYFTRPKFQTCNETRCFMLINSNLPFLFHQCDQ